ncbi:hypothetical protein K8Q93_00630 [Candidatus Parcubacteria bacterium]|nr:hypothetical protein [Candidatus Parcubacteria bacterium]
MSTLFLSLEPKKRFQRMRQLLQNFKQRAVETSAPFGILAYGSVSYGFNGLHYGKLDDIDLFLIVPRVLSAKNILDAAKEVFQTEFDLSLLHMEQMLAGKWDMCRMYGKKGDVKLGFRLLCRDVFDHISSPQGMQGSILNVAKLGSSRIIADVEWSLPEWKYISTELDHFTIKEEGDESIVVLHHVFSPRGERLGALGRKLLTCTVVHDPTSHLSQGLEEVWKSFVQACLAQHPSLETSAIIDAVMRSEKFSISFRKRLTKTIETARQLSLRLSL